MVFHDRSYAPLQDSPDSPRFATLPHLQNRVLTAQSAGPSLGLPCGTLGWLAGPAPLIEACTVTQAFQAAMPAEPVQRLGLQWLQAPPPALTQFLEQLPARRQAVTERLRKLGLQVETAYAGYLLWVDVSVRGLSGRNFMLELLRSQRVLVDCGDHFGPGGEQKVRISLVGDEGRLREGLSRIERFVTG